MTKIFREIEELSRTPAKKDVKPISGYLTFEPGITSHVLQIQSVQDQEDEGNEVFAVKLLSGRGGARITRADGIGKVTGIVKPHFVLLSS